MRPITRALWLALAGLACAESDPVSPSEGEDADVSSQHEPDAAGSPAPGDQVGPPSDDPLDYVVDSSVEYVIEVSEPRFVVPSAGLPSGIVVQAANNNVDIEFSAERLYMAWRSGPFHFASDQVQMIVVSSLDGGESWELETVIDLDTDLREPRFLRYQGRLLLFWFEAGSDPLAFKPQRIWRSEHQSTGVWSEPEIFIDEPEVPWDIKVRGGLAYMTSYIGEHYEGEGAVVDVLFKSSEDGERWAPLGGAEFVYRGGASEAAFEFDADGSLWAVTRNEDGDESGFGSHVCFAPADALWAWQCPAVCDPERYDSPEMFRHGDRLYLVARRDIGGSFGPDGDFIAYSARPKTTALYAIDKVERQVVHLLDLPGAGDTAFPSVRRTGAHSFLLANYTSPLEDPGIGWLEGQAAEEGTGIYLLEINFRANPR